MKFQYVKHGIKSVFVANSVEELPFDVKREIGCKAWSECGFIGVNYNYNGRDFDGHLIYDQVMPLDLEALNWIKDTFDIE